MPTYSYKCLTCGTVFDIEATLQEKEEGKSEKLICPKCQSKNVKQKFSTGNFIKNVFQINKKSGGCCSGGNMCDAGCTPDEKGKKIHSNGGCCG